MLGNLTPSLPSSLNGIQLLTIPMYRFITKYGVDKVLQPLMNDLTELEEVCSYMLLRVVVVTAPFLKL